MTHSLVKELNAGQKEVSMLVNTRVERNKDMELTHGQMALYIKVIGSITELMVSVNISGKMADSTTEIGTIMTCMVWVFISILMELRIKANTKKTRKQVTVSISGQMAESTRAGGTMESNMGLESTRIQVKVKLSMVSGNTASE